MSGLGVWRLIWAAYNQGAPLAATLQIDKTGCLASTVGNTCGFDKAVSGSVEKINVDYVFPSGYSEFIAQGSIWVGDYPDCFLWQADLKRLIIHAAAGDRAVDWKTSWFTLRN